MEIVLVQCGTRVASYYNIAVHIIRVFMIRETVCSIMAKSWEKTTTKTITHAHLHVDTFISPYLYTTYITKKFFLSASLFCKYRKRNFKQFIRLVGSSNKLVKPFLFFVLSFGFFLSQVLTNFYTLRLVG